MYVCGLVHFLLLPRQRSIKAEPGYRARGYAASGHSASAPRCWTASRRATPRDSYRFPISTLQCRTAAGECGVARSLPPCWRAGALGAAGCLHSIYLSRGSSWRPSAAASRATRCSAPATTHERTSEPRARAMSPQCHLNVCAGRPASRQLSATDARVRCAWPTPASAGATTSSAPVRRWRWRPFDGDAR